MTVPPDRITQESNPVLWESLYKQWIAERKPGWVVRRSGGESYLVVQTTSGSLAFDPQVNKSYYDDTGI